MSGGLPLVDAHQHFQDVGHYHYPWLCDRDGRPRLEGDIGPIRRNYLPADYAQDTAGFDVGKTVHVQNGWDPTDPVGESRWLQQLSTGTGRPTAIVAFADTRPLLGRVIKAFGPDRVMVGTNLPVDRLFAPGRTILGAVAALTAGLSEAEKRAVLSGTAERVYRI